MICGKISTKMSVTVLLKNNGFLSTVGEDKKKQTLSKMLNLVHTQITLMTTLEHFLSRRNKHECTDRNWKLETV
jgi:hypothetical protein